MITHDEQQQEETTTTTTTTTNTTNDKSKTKTWRTRTTHQNTMCAHRNALHWSLIINQSMYMRRCEQDSCRMWYDFNGKWCGVGEIGGLRRRPSAASRAPFFNEEYLWVPAEGSTIRYGACFHCLCGVTCVFRCGECLLLFFYRVCVFVRTRGTACVCVRAAARSPFIKHIRKAWYNKEPNKEKASQLG